MDQKLIINNPQDFIEKYKRALRRTKDRLNIKNVEFQKIQSISDDVISFSSLLNTQFGKAVENTTQTISSILNTEFFSKVELLIAFLEKTLENGIKEQLSNQVIIAQMIKAQHEFAENISQNVAEKRLFNQPTSFEHFLKIFREQVQFKTNENGEKVAIPKNSRNYTQDSEIAACYPALIAQTSDSAKDSYTAFYKDCAELKKKSTAHLSKELPVTTQNTPDSLTTHSKESIAVYPSPISQQSQNTNKPIEKSTLTVEQLTALINKYRAALEKTKLTLQQLSLPTAALSKQVKDMITLLEFSVENGVEQKMLIPQIITDFLSKQIDQLFLISASSEANLFKKYLTQFRLELVGTPFAKLYQSFMSQEREEDMLTALIEDFTSLQPETAVNQVSSNNTAYKYQ